MPKLRDKVIVEPIADLAALKAIDTTSKDSGILVNIGSMGVFRLVKPDTTAADDLNVVAPTTGTGRWFRQTMPNFKINGSGKIDASIIPSDAYTAGTNLQLIGNQFSTVANPVFTSTTSSTSGNVKFATTDSVNTNTCFGYGTEAGVSTLGTTKIGYRAGFSSNTGWGNTFNGYRAGESEATGSNNTYIGYDSGRTANGAAGNVGVGFYALKAITTGGYNVAVGHGAGSAITSGGRSVCIGASAAASQTINSIIAIGVEAGRYSTGPNNLFIGESAGLGLDGLSTGEENTGIGYSSFYKYSTGSRNTCIGSLTGMNISSGIENVIVGHGAGTGLTTGSNHVFIGKSAGSGFSTSTGSVCIGYKAGESSTGSLISIGSDAGKSSSGTNNIFIGPQAGVGSGSSSNGSHNIAIGTESFGKWANATNNICLGYRSGKEITTAAGNVIIGHQAGLAVVSSGGSVFIGANAGAAINTQHSNICIGNGAGSSALGSLLCIGADAGKYSAGYYHIFIGERAGLGVASTSYSTLYNVAVGVDSFKNWTTAGACCFFGHSSGSAITSGSGNVGVGYSVMSSATTAADTVAIGTQSLISITTQTGNTAAGRGSGKNAISSNCCYFGISAGLNNTKDGVVSIGAFSGQNNASDRLTSVGYKAAGAATTVSGNDGTFVGYSSGENNTSGASNSYFGSYSGRATTTGSNNVFVGANSGATVTTGTNNIFIGYNTDQTGSVARTNAIAIGAGATVDEDNKTVIGNSSTTKATIYGIVSPTGGISLPNTGGSASVLSYYGVETQSTTLTGIWAAAQNITITYTRIGNTVIIKFPTVTASATISAPITVTAAAPAQLRPSTDVSSHVYVLDGDVDCTGTLIMNSSGVVRIYLNTVSGVRLVHGGFTPGNIAGVVSCSAVYML